MGKKRALLGTLLRRYLKPGGSGIFLLDIHCYDPPECLLVADTDQIAKGRRTGLFTEESMEAMIKYYEGETLGLGGKTAGSPGLIREPIDYSYEACMEESRLVMLTCAKGAMKAANITPREVDIVITACTFTPVPSLSAMVASYFEMRSDVLHYSLGGQGCTSGIIEVELAAHLLRAKAGRVALLLAHENITNGFYPGNDKQLLVANVLFKLGGSAAVMSTRPQDRRRAKYELMCTERTIRTSAADLDCIQMRTDAEGHVGIQLEHRQIRKSAAAAIASNLRRLGPRVLPMSEMTKVARNPKYLPDFSKAFKHVLIHPGAKIVIDQVADALKFPESAKAPSRATLERFGNTSLSSTFYILANIESTTGVKRGEKLLQMAMGSGFKAVTAVWRARRNVRTNHAAWRPREGDFAKAAPGTFSKTAGCITCDAPDYQGAEASAAAPAAAAAAAPAEEYDAALGDVPARPQPRPKPVPCAREPDAVIPDPLTLQPAPAPEQTPRTPKGQQMPPGAQLYAIAAALETAPA